MTGKFRRFLPAGILIALACPAALGGQGSDVLEMSLEQLMQLPITGSTLSDESLRSVPSAVTVFHHEQIQRMGIEYLHELLAFVPGYQPQHSADNAYAYTYSARGRRNSTEAREILLLIDGRAFSDPHTGSGDGAFPLVPVAQIERVEVIRGPGSALYGSSAFTGVINIITRQGHNEAGLAAGSGESRHAHLLASRRQGAWQADFFAHSHDDRGQSFTVPDSWTAGNIDTRDPLRNSDLDLSLRHAGTRFRAAHHQVSTRNFYSLETIANDFNRFRSQITQASLEQDLQPRHEFNLHLFAGYLQTRHDFNVQITAPGALSGASTPDSADPLLAKGVLEAESWQLKLD